MKISPERLGADAEATRVPARRAGEGRPTAGVAGSSLRPAIISCAVSWLSRAGRAFNLFVFDVPRLSVDIDLNYVGAVDQGGHAGGAPTGSRKPCRPSFGREDFEVRRMFHKEHAGRQVVALRYAAVVGAEAACIEVDLNYMYRVPLWPVAPKGLASPWEDWQAKEIPV